MLRTLEQNKRYRALLDKLGIVDKEQKQDLVLSVSEGRVKSSADLTFEEMNMLCTHLQGLVYEMDDRADKMRKKILSICHEMNWKLASGKVDMQHLSDWLLKYGYLHKELNEYTEKELPKLVTQMEGVLEDYLKKL